MSQKQGLNFINQLASYIISEQLQLLYAPRFLTFCSSDQSLLLFKIQNFCFKYQFVYFLYCTLCKYIQLYNNMHGYGRRTDLLSQAYLYGRTQLALQLLIIVRTIIHYHSKIFTTGHARVTLEHCIIKCVGGRQVFQCPYGFLSFAVCCSKSIEPTNYFSTLFIT